MGRGSSLSRRHVLAGAVSVPMLGLIEATPANSRQVTDLQALGNQLDQLIRRCRRLHREVCRQSSRCSQICAERGIKPFMADGRRNTEFDALHLEQGYDAAWALWSGTVADSLDVAEKIRKISATSPADLSVKHRALLHELFHDDMVDTADPVHVRLLRQFGKELASLAATPGP